MKKAPKNRGLGVEPVVSTLVQGAPKATSSSWQVLFSSGRLSWLRSSSIDSP